ncbi:protein NRT1/ PTR FAMILY 2.8 [Andrographis paniculata]|uniref:protein NRT1/ PTR FAMILY 2.8 n=1 Tax=Andrographis paniculata TaxID=175694 RepID=UPI0021E8D682|nr:protein NRT1/ PTR FAMILY 2.8 [Andrographis paniculata]
MAMEMEMEMEAASSPPISRSKSRKRGGWRAIKYILGNESFEKLASMSLTANITVYLRNKYNLSGIFLVNVVNIWNGSCNLLSTVGAIVSDAYLGRFLTLLCGTILSLLGIGALTITAAVPQLRPPPCPTERLCIQPHKGQLALLFISLILVALGAGGIRPCNIAFGADQFDTSTNKGRIQLQSFFNWWYFSFTIALIIALTGVVYVQTNISWSIGFAIPTACFALSTAVFWFGRHTYLYKSPEGSVFVDMAKVVVAAFRRRKADLKLVHEPTLYNPSGDIAWEARKLVRTDKFGFFDRAAVVTDPSEIDAQGLAVDNWKLCSVQQVENLKCVLGVAPVWLSGIFCFVVMDQQSTYGILQAIQTDRSIGRHFTIPPGWIGITSMVTLTIWILIYEQLYIRIVKKVVKRDSRLTMQQRISVGIIMSILCMFVAGTVEKHRRASAVKNGTFSSPLHVTFLFPQFALSGLTEAFAAVALLEFYTLKLPQSLRSVAGAIFFVSLSIGSYLSSLIVNVVHSATGGKNRTPWLGGPDLNMNRLDNYYYILGGLGLINFVYFIFFARKYLPSGEDENVERNGADPNRTSIVA